MLKKKVLKVKKIKYLLKINQPRNKKKTRQAKYQTVLEEKKNSLIY